MKTEKLPRGIRKRGDSYVVYLTHPDGREEKRSCGVVSRKFAIDQRAIWRREIAEGKYSKPVARKQIVTFAAIADAAVQHAKDYQRTWDADTGRAEVCKEWFAGGSAVSITTAMIDAKLLERVRSGKWSECTANEYRVWLVRCYNLAIERGEVGFNPALKAHRFEVHNARKRELTADEETRLRAAIRANYPATKLLELDLLLNLGCRCSNLYGISKSRRKPMEPLQWSAVDLNWKVVTFPRSKAGEGYQVPLNETAVAAFEELKKLSPDGTGSVIRKPSGIVLQSCRKWFEQSCKKAGITGLRPHDLRHTFGTRLRRNRVPLEDIAALMGHDLETNRMTQRYAHADLETLRSAVATLVSKPAQTETQTGTKTGTSPVLEIRRAETA